MKSIYHCIKISVVLLFFVAYSQAQDSLRIGEWESLLPYKSGKWVTQSDQKIIYATAFSLLLIDKEDNSASFLSKIEGLSDTGIELIKYDDYNNQLIVVYANSNIDIVTEDGIFNESSIKNNSNIIGSRQVNDIEITGPDRIFLTTAFGILEYRSVKKEFGTTIFTSTPILGIEKINEKLFVTSEDGLYVIDEGEHPNISDFSQWKLLGSEQGLPIFYEGVDVEEYNGVLYFTDGLSIWMSNDEGMTFSKIYEEEDNSYSITFLSSGNTKLMAGLRASGSSRLIYIDELNNINEISRGCIDRIRYSIEDEKGQFWFADNFREFRFMDNPQGTCKRLDYNSPLSEKASDIALGDDLIVIASGGVTDAYRDLFSRDGVFISKEGRWDNINEDNYPPFKENDLLNFFKVELSEDESHVYMGTFWRGILKYDLTTAGFDLFNENNSALQPATGDGKVRISDMVHDREGNLWITNYNAPRPLVIKNKDGEWYNFSIPGDNRVGDLVVDEDDNKWLVTLGTTNGVLVFNEGEDILASSDNKSRLINLNNSVIPTTIVYTVAMDLEGDIWVGTAEGVIVFERGQDIFNNEYQGLRKTVEVDSIGAFLLETEEVRTIGIDGANRKWFGTRNGIFVQSPEGDKEVERFTVENSPLFDNEIIDLSYHGKTGLMYIATNKGVQVVKTSTTIGKKSHDSNVYAYPNPVYPEYQGPIAIKGLANNAAVKITDLSGKLVFETQALGGQAIWNGKDLSGSKVNTGVYLIFSTSESNFGETDSYVSKILFID